MLTAIAEQEPRRQRIDETLERIMELALAEFGEKGLQGARMEAIAREAGVPKQFIYYHFRSRDGLYQAVMEQICRTCTDRILSLDYESMSALAAVKAMFRTMFDIHAELPYVARLTLDFNFNGGVHMERTGLPRRVRQLFDTLVDRGVEEGVFPPHINRRATFFLAVTMLGAYFSRPGGSYFDMRIEDIGDLEGWWETVIRAIIVVMTAG